MLAGGGGDDKHDPLTRSAIAPLVIIGCCYFPATSSNLPVGSLFQFSNDQDLGQHGRAEDAPRAAPDHPRISGAIQAAEWIHGAHRGQGATYSVREHIL